MQVITETELLERINAFRERHDNMAPTTFGRNATGNANLIRELEEGKSPSLRTVQRVVSFMNEVDDAAATQAKLHAPLDATADEEAADVPLPFSTAPVNPTGASSPTSSSTCAHQRPHAESASSRSSSADASEADAA